MMAPWEHEMPPVTHPLTATHEALLPLLAVAAIGDGWRRYYVQRVSAEHASRRAFDRCARDLEGSLW